jgi:hypothetical protein
MDDHPPADRAGGRPRTGRRRRRLTLVAAAVAAAAVAVPLIVAEAQSGSGAKGPAPAHAVRPGPPALAGVYAGSGYKFNTSNSIAADASHVWVLNGGNDSVTEFSARTGAWIQTLNAAKYGFSQTGSDTTGIVDDGTDVWVGNLDTVTEISAKDGSLVRILRIPDSANIHGWPTAMVRAGTQLWGVTPETCRPYCGTSTAIYASLIEFSASGGTYERVLMRTAAQDPIALASDGAHVWFAASTVNGHDASGADAAGSVTEFDAGDGHQIWSAPATIYSSQATSGDSIAYAGGRLWVANGKSVTELNASNGKTVRVLSGDQYQFTAQPVIAVAGTRVFVLNGEGNSVTEFNANTGALMYTLTAARYDLNNPVGIAVVGNRAWILNSPLNAASYVVQLALGAG